MSWFQQIMKKPPTCDDNFNRAPSEASAMKFNPVCSNVKIIKVLLV